MFIRFTMSSRWPKLWLMYLPPFSSRGINFFRSPSLSYNSLLHSPLLAQENTPPTDPEAYASIML